ncbi:MAG: hypothetical protein M0R77_00875 [Gammaproteobacteria bacterium]|nr:hypothetical protein [Acholeplasmataceae bacterium]MCK9529108.1 hypothetical protein [Gammaproteobacteria bacterium]
MSQQDSVRWGNTPESNRPSAAGQETNEKVLASDQLGQERYNPDELGVGIFGAGMQMSFNSGSEILFRAKEALDAQVKKASEQLRRENQIKLTILDRSEHKRLPYSALVLSLTNPLVAKGTSFFVFVIAGDQGAIVRNEILPNNQGQCETLSLPADALNQVIKEAGEILRGLNPGVTDLFSASGIVVTNDTFSWDSEKDVYQLLARGYNSCLAVLSSKGPRWDDVNLAKVMGSELEVVLQRTRGQAQPRDVLGRPKRRDLEVSLRTRQVMSPQTGDIIHKAETIASLSVYGDLLWGPETVQKVNQFGQPVVETKTYKQRVIITQMRNHQAYTLGSQLMSFIPAIALFQPKATHQAFIPSPDSSMGKSDDVGVLQLEAKYHQGNMSGQEAAQRVDVFNSPPTLISDYLEKILSDNIEVALDIEVGGEDYLHNSVLLKAALSGSGASGNKDHDRAYTKLVETMTVLTNGKFADFWQTGAPIAFVDSVREVGHFTNDDGNLEDTRHVDTISTMNKFIENNPDYYRVWSDAQVATNRTMQARMRDMRNVTEYMISPPTYTTRVFRVILSAAFVKAYFDSISALGIRLNLVLPNETRTEDRTGYVSTSSSIQMGVGAGMLNTFGGSVAGTMSPSNFQRWSA